MANDPSEDPRPPVRLGRDRLLGIPDAEIVARLRDGDAEMFRALFLAYHQSLVSAATFLVSSVSRAEDIVADVMLKLWQRRAEWTIRHSVESYLFSAVRHGVYNAVRSSKREEGWTQRFEHDDTPPGMGDAPEHPDVQIANADLRERLWGVIAQLPERTQFILVLRWEQEMSFDEIAETIGITVAAVRQIHSRALRFLRDTLPDILR